MAAILAGLAFNEEEARSWFRAQNTNVLADGCAGPCKIALPAIYWLNRSAKCCTRMRPLRRGAGRKLGSLVPMNRGAFTTLNGSPGQADRSPLYSPTVCLLIARFEFVAFLQPFRLPWAEAEIVFPSYKFLRVREEICWLSPNIWDTAHGGCAATSLRKLWTARVVAAAWQKVLEARQGQPEQLFTIAMP